MNHWIDEAALGAGKLYLKRCESGGMPATEAHAVRKALEGMAYTGYFSAAIAEAITAQGLTLTQAGPVKEDEPVEIRISEHMFEGKPVVIAMCPLLQLGAQGETRKKAIEALMVKLEERRLEALRALDRCERIMVEDVIALLHQERAGETEPDLGAS